MTPEAIAYAMILCGFIMLFAEIFVPSFGLLGVGGLALFTWGSSKILDGDQMLIIWAIDGAALMIMFIISMVYLRSRKQKTITGVEGMIGHEAEVIDWKDGEGLIQINGELWQARSQAGTAFTPGQMVEVSGHDDLILTVRKD